MNTFIYSPEIDMGEQFEAVGNIVRTCRDENGRGGFLVAEAPVTRSDSHELAALFAAAPELLSALTFILRGIDAGHIKCAPYFDFDPEATQIEFKSPAELARAATNKAKQIF